MIFGDSDVTKCQDQKERETCLRPVGIVVDSEGGIYFSMDSVGQVVRLEPDPAVVGIQAVSSGEGGIGGKPSLPIQGNPIPTVTATTGGINNKPGSAAGIGSRTSWSLGMAIGVLLML